MYIHFTYVHCIGVSADLVQLTEEQRMDAVRRQSFRLRGVSVSVSVSVCQSVCLRLVCLSHTYMCICVCLFTCFDVCVCLCLCLCVCHSFGDCIRPNLGEFDDAKSNFSLKRSSKNFATKRSHFAKCIRFRKRDRRHEGEFFYYFARRRDRCESFHLLEHL
jgi:hypothetical protein